MKKSIIACIAAAAVLCGMIPASPAVVSKQFTADAAEKNISDVVNIPHVGEVYEVSVGNTTETPQWFSDDTSIAEVTPDGDLSAHITAVGVGTTYVYAVLSPVGLRGYVFVEGMNTDRLQEKTREIKKARSFVDRKDISVAKGTHIPAETSIEEISSYLVPVSAVIGIEEGDLVELVNGPFKGERARVQRIDQAKEEITVELVDAMVPIPVTVKGDSVKLIEKEN